MNELDLIQGAKNGDMEAFNQLILEYQEMAFNVAVRMVNDYARAEDITQDAFISAFMKIKTFRGGSFKAWLMRIVTNASYDELRRLKRRPTVSLTPMNSSDEEVESPSWLADPGESPEERAQRSELNRVIQECLDRLDHDFRLAILLIDIQGFDYREASDVIKKPLGTIKSRLARARGKMQDCLQGFEELLPKSMRLNSERIE